SGDLSSTHSAIIVPKPNNSDIYYVFTVDTYNDGDTNGLQYSEVDMTLNSTLGDVTANKNIPLEPIVNEKVIAILNYNEDGYWVVSHKHNSNEFIAFEITDSGVNTIPVTSPTGFNTGFYYNTGQIKISPDGSKLALSHGKVQLFDFDNSTGIVSNPRTITESSVNSYGIEFSPDGNILYVAFVGGIYQFNLLAGSLSDIIASQLNLIDINESFSSLQLAPDNRIYIAR